MTQIEATFHLIAPAKNLIGEGEIDCNMDPDEASALIYGELLEFLRKNPSVFALENYYNTSDRIEYRVDEKVIHQPQGKHFDNEVNLFEIRVKARGNLQDDSRLDSKKSWLENISPDLDAMEIDVTHQG